MLILCFNSSSSEKSTKYCEKLQRKPEEHVLLECDGQKYSELSRGYKNRSPLYPVIYSIM